MWFLIEINEALIEILKDNINNLLFCFSGIIENRKKINLSIDFEFGYSFFDIFDEKNYNKLSKTNSYVHNTHTVAHQ